MREIIGRIAAAALAGLGAAANAQDDNLTNYDGFWMPLNDFVVFDADQNPTTTDDQVRISGNIGVYLDALNVIGDGGDITFGTSVGSVSGLLLEADVAAEFDRQRLLVPGPPLVLPPLVFTLGGGATEIVLTPMARFGVTLDGNVEGGVTLDLATQQDPVLIGVRIDGSRVRLGPGGDDIDVVVLHSEPCIVDGNSGASIGLAPYVLIEFMVEVNGTVGWPSILAGVAPGVQFNLRPLGDPWWSLWGTAYAEAAVGWSLNSPEIVPWTRIIDADVVRIADAGGPLDGLGGGDDARWARIYDESPGLTNQATAVTRSAIDLDGYAMIMTSGVRGVVVELDSSGSAVSAMNVSSSLYDVLVTDGGNYLLRPTGSRLLEVTPDGTVVWAKGYDDLDSAYAPQPLAFDRADDGGYWVAGFHQLTTGRHGMLMRLDSAGEVLWARHYAPTGGPPSFEGVAATLDGGAIAVGCIGDSPLHDREGALIVKVDAVGEIEWAHVVESTHEIYGNPVAHLVEVAPDGGYVIGGVVNRAVYSPERLNAFLIKVDAAGNPVWEVLHAEEVTPGWDTWDTVYDRATSLLVDDHGYTLTGHTGLADARDAWLWRVDGIGRPVWFKSLHGNRNDQLNHVIAAPDGGLLAVGTTNSWTHDGSDTLHALAMKTGIDGMVAIEATLGGGELVNPSVLVDDWSFVWSDAPDPSGALNIVAYDTNFQVAPTTLVQEDLTRR